MELMRSFETRVGPMRVGVYVASPPAESGGTFTFQQGLLAAVMRASATSEHEWIPVFGRPGKGSETESVSGLRPKDLVGSSVKHFFKLLRDPRTSRLHPPAFSDAYSLATRAKLSSLDLDFIWSLSPNALTFELPFAIHAWDLEHRVHPGFPEVGAASIWTSRERATAQAAQRASLIFTGTEFGAREVSRFYGIGDERIMVLPMPTPRDCLDLAEEPVRGEAQAAEPYFLYPAQFWAHKNHVVLLDALVALREKGLPMPLIKFSGSDQGNLSYIKSEVARLGLSERVAFLGFIDRAELLRQYAGATGLLFPSLFGPDNIPPLEAMALRCPAVVAEVSGMKEQLGTAALHVDALSGSAWASAMTALMTDRALRSSLIEQGLQLARDRSVDIYAQQAMSAVEQWLTIRRRWA